MTVSLTDIEHALERLSGAALRTPLLRCAELSERAGASVLIKPENLQHIGAFKFRGAYNRLAQLDRDEQRAGVVAFSSGNHAQGVAYAAKLLGIPATIVMPTDAPRIKLENTRRLGAEVRLYERQDESREQIASAIAAERGAVLVPSYDDPDVIAGQGTCGYELVEQAAALGMRPAALLVPCGGGGLLAGVSSAVRALLPETAIYGVEPENFDDHARSWKSGVRESVPGTHSTLCDSLMTPTPGALTWSINQTTVSDFLVVTEDEVRHAVSFAFRYLKLVVEPGGAVALAALLSKKLNLEGQELALILSGGNIDPLVLDNCLSEYPDP
ncbi:MAG: threonine ammonia-lyase [Pseudohongiellaceae bacterium]